MDVILQIFKRSIGLGTPFFEFLVKKALAMINDLFRRADKYSMLEDDVLTNRSTKDDEAGNSKPSNQSRQASKGWVG